MTDHRCHRGERCQEAERLEQRLEVCGECSCHDGYGRSCSVPGGCGHMHKPVLVKLGGRIPAQLGLCPTCTRVVQDAITELPRDYVDLHLALERGSAGLQELVAASKDLPAGVRVGIAALAAEIVRVATVWAEPVSDKLGIDWDTRRMDLHTRPGYALQRAARLLSNAMSVLLALRDVEVQSWADNGWYHTHEPANGIDGALVLLQLHQITRAALGQTKLVHELSAPCPNCESHSLVRDDGDDNVHCRRCRLQWPEEDYRRLTLILASDYVAPPSVKHRRLRNTTEGAIGRPVEIRA